MNSLLKRQIRKYVPKALAEHPELTAFFDAVNRSYTNHDEQFVMQQRAMAISSEELFNANEKLRNEAEAQRTVITKLKRLVETLRFYDIPNQQFEESKDIEEDGLKLLDFITAQAKKIIDIDTQREKLLKELEYQNQELSDYAHMVSHDLKTPLRSIDALSTWLKEDYIHCMDTNGKERLDLIRSNVEKIDTLINGILEYSTISKNQVDTYDVDLDKLVENTIGMIDVPNHIKIVKNDNFPTIKGDKYRLQQLFQNLIVNAIKYNDKEKGLVEIGFENANKFWEFYVRDNGKGIDKKYFKKIFKPFEKLDTNTNATGIGLSLVKKIVDALGGIIWLESEKNKGTTFYFTLKKR
jgi:signal transduction histidine kinase